MSIPFNAAAAAYNNASKLISQGLSQGAGASDPTSQGPDFAKLLSEAVQGVADAGKASDQKALAEHSPVPLAIVNGADDPMINVRYVGRLTYRNLWDDHYYLLRGVGHAPFLSAPHLFDPIFERFLADMARSALRKTGHASGLVAA